MTIVGITGGIGSGKTTVAKIFSVLGVPVYNADTEAARLLEEDESVRNPALGIFGNEVVLPNNRLDRKKIALKVFSDPALLERLNQVIHPAVRKHFMNWIKVQRNHPYILKEAAVLFESGAYKDVDAIICVTAPEEIRIRRVQNRDGISEKDVTDRMHNQWTEEEKVKRSEYVIVNDGSTAVIPQVMELHAKLTDQRNAK